MLEVHVEIEVGAIESTRDRVEPRRDPGEHAGEVLDAALPVVDVEVEANRERGPDDDDLVVVVLRTPTPGQELRFIVQLQAKELGRGNLVAQDFLHGVAHRLGRIIAEPSHPVIGLREGAKVVLVAHRPRVTATRYSGTMRVRVWTIGLGLAVGCGGGAEGPESTGVLRDGHGSVMLTLSRGEGIDDSPFAETATIRTTLNYGSCLREFYDANPNWHPAGEDGQPVFERWADELCAQSSADCTVDEIEQNLMGDRRLTVTYAVQGELENRRLAFGPLPTESLAGCDPIVEIRTTEQIFGVEASGSQVWEVRNFRPTAARTDQGEEIILGIGPHE